MKTSVVQTRARHAISWVQQQNQKPHARVTENYHVIIEFLQLQETNRLYLASFHLPIRVGRAGSYKFVWCWQGHVIDKLKQAHEV